MPRVTLGKGLACIYLVIYSNIISGKFFIFVFPSSTISRTVLKNSLSFKVILFAACDWCNLRNIIARPSLGAVRCFWPCVVISQLNFLQLLNKIEGWKKAAGTPGAIKFQLKMRNKLANLHSSPLYFLYPLQILCNVHWMLVQTRRNL